MKSPFHTTRTIMAHPHTLPSSPAREGGHFLKNEHHYYSRPVHNEGLPGNRLSRKEDDVVSHDKGILDHIVPISLSFQGGNNV
jgi:hypothetical protein